MLLETRNFFPSLQRNTTPAKSGSQLVSYSSDLGNNGSILVLIHGYPQSAFIWRHLVPSLRSKYSLFIPELPGYGISTPPTTTGTDTHPYSKKSIGTSILEALASVFSITPADPRKVILGGHDRGARICHRLTVDKSEFLPSLGLEITATILLDIVPTKVQWELFAKPGVSTGYFHWPLLANVEVATAMITAFGGGNWARAALRLAGNEKGLGRIMADGAVDVYAGLFEKEEAIRGSCEDYKAAAGVDYEEQVRDQAAEGWGRKKMIEEVPVLVMFSNVGLGSKSDVAGTWKEWVGPGTVLEAVGVDGYGHYLPEEAHDVVLERMVGFLDKYT